mmetsp:Transcript_37451/g.36024  ORF Transcript_37451/g.36024 Transcript_37451/m.36024 type:complete len:90 (-) Transcript_37451:174-443(-)|eukprot:CAMPEP_0170564530 /NCGR_PEP_ID=MMETSP0211-20121228/73418_1 /TAXON_ID=311385 /ORGANISM="Pseudokeronopsis sp., Strain OXSARD2" /LENGTH=89 /DNA_ID=CAMNT_0010884111 /DNA_START=45 /DNA_END=314 /DNA_ORIENTATION=-
MESLNEEMKELIQTMEYYLMTRNVRLDLLLNNIRLKHPIFKYVSLNAFRFLIENSFLFKVQEGQYVYKEQQRPSSNTYFILYGGVRFEK